MNPFQTIIYDKINKKEIVAKDITIETDKNQLQILLAHNDSISNRRYVIGDVYYNETKNEFYIFSLLRVDAVNHKTNSIEDSVIKSFGFNLYKNENITFVNKMDFFDKHTITLDDSEYIGNIFKNNLNYKNENQINNFILANLKINNLNTELIYKVNGQHYTINLKTLKTFTGDAMTLKKIINEPFTFDIEIKFKSAKGEIWIMSEYNGSLFKLRDVESLEFIDEDIRNVKLLNKDTNNLISFYKELFVFLNNNGNISYLSTSSITSDEKIKGYPITSYSVLDRSSYEIFDYIRNMGELYQDAVLRAL